MKLQGRCIQIANGTDSGLLSVCLGLLEYLTHEQIEEIKSIIQRDDFKCLRKGKQGGDAPVVWHTRNGLRPGRRGITR